MLSARKMAQGERLPFGYGFSYYSAYSDHIIAYPFPFHWVVRWARSFWAWAVRPPTPDSISEAYYRGRADQSRHYEEHTDTMARIISKVRQSND